jgi:hypothetical protein
VQFMLKYYPIMLITASLWLAACGNPAGMGGTPRILPVDCFVNARGSLALSLDGVIPQNAGIRWEVSAGSIVSAGQRLNAVFTAPEVSADVVISVYISSGTPGNTEVPVTRSCTVTANPASPSPAQNNALLPSGSTAPGGPTVIISEVMAHPCGSDDFKKWNEYVELYNFGDQPVDVGGWRLVDNGPDNKADQIVAWNARNPRAALKQHVVADTTVIPPHAFAVVLSPTYTQSLDPFRMPYSLPDGTIILTIIEGDRIGDDVFGLIGDGGSRDVLVLYIGGAKSIQQVVSTYGSPNLGIYPQDIRDDRADNLPLDLHECTSAERIDPFYPDEFDSWREVQNGSPGEAPYP